MKYKRLIFCNIITNAPVVHQLLVNRRDIPLIRCLVHELLEQLLVPDVKDAEGKTEEHNNTEHSSTVSKHPHDMFLITSISHVLTQISHIITQISRHHIHFTHYHTNFTPDYINFTCNHTNSTRPPHEFHI